MRKYSYSNKNEKLKKTFIVRLFSIDKYFYFTFLWRIVWKKARFVVMLNEITMEIKFKIDVICRTGWKEVWSKNKIGAISSN